MEDDFKPVVQQKRLVNPKIHEVIKAEVIKLLDAGLIYPISDSPWVSPIHVVPKKGGMPVVTNESNELIPTRLVTGWRLCIDYRKLNDVTRKDHFHLPFMDQMLERLAGNEFYCFLDGFSGYFQIPIDPQDQEKTTFTCPYGTFAYRQMPFGLCNAPGTFQRYTMLQRCEDTNLVLNWEKCHFMVKEGIVLGHKISKNGLEVDRAKVDVIAKLPPPTTVKGVRSFLGHAGFYRRFIQYFSKIARPMTHLLEKDTPFVFSDECLASFKFLKKRLTEAPILEFTIEIRDKKGAENLAADHLSRLENPYQGDRVGMEINDNFPHESLSMISLNPDIIPPWFADIANYLVGNTGRKLWTFSKLAIVDPPGDTMARTTPRKKPLTSDFSGPPFIEMPRTLSHIVTRVSVRERSHNGTKCPKILFRFVRFLTSRASISWGRSRLQEGTDIFSWLSTMFRNGLKRKRSPPTTPE
ncbi:reverse transcriptase domain-containing protein [Tanacetum coccineum]